MLQVCLQGQAICPDEHDSGKLQVTIYDGFGATGGWIQKRKARALHESTLLAQNTINLFNRSLRELCHAHMLRLERTQIGGEGMIVEIDEMKLSKRK